MQTLQNVMVALGRLVVALSLILAVGGCAEEYIDLRPDRSIHEAGGDLPPSKDSSLPDLLPTGCAEEQLVEVKGPQGSSGIIAGTVKFADAQAKGLRVGIALLKNPGAGIAVSNGLPLSDEAAYAILPSNAVSFKFRAQQLKPGKYSVLAWVDANGDNIFNKGDLAGYNGATLAKPVQSGEDSTLIEITAQSEPKCTLEFWVAAY